MDEVVVVVVLLLVVVAVVVSSAMVLLDLSSMAWSDEVASFGVTSVDHYCLTPISTIRCKNHRLLHYCLDIVIFAQNYQNHVIVLCEVFRGMCLAGAHNANVRDALKHTET
jgi:hypothetical protein